MAQEERRILGQGIPCYFLDHSFTLSPFITPAFRGIRSFEFEKETIENNECLMKTGVIKADKVCKMYVHDT